MLVVILRFIFHAVVHLNWSWTSSTREAATIFNIKQRNIHSVVSQYIDPANDQQIFPRELERQKVGCGSAKFLVNDVDERFKVMKEAHLGTKNHSTIRSYSQPINVWCLYGAGNTGSSPADTRQIV